MKISRKDLRRIILEAVIKEQEDNSEDSTEENDSSSIMDRIGSAVSTALDQVSGPIPATVSSAVDGLEKAFNKDVDGDGDVGEETTSSGDENSSQAQTQASSSASNSKKEKIKKIQAAMQLAGAYPEPNGNDDGIWGRGTSDAWKEFVKKTDTVKRFKALEAQNNSEATTESRSLYEFFTKIINEQSEEADPLDGLSDKLKNAINSGQAAEVAKHFGLKGTLTGVAELIDKLQNVDVDDDTPEEDPEETPEEDEAEETSELSAQENLTLGENPISISFEKFKQDSGGNAIQPRSEGRVVNIDLNKENIELPDEISKNNKELKNFNRLFFIEDKKAILIKRLGKNYKLTPFKKDGEFIVQQKSSGDEVTPPAETETPGSVQESLSHGALIRRRYRRY